VQQRNTYPFPDLGTFDLTLTSADPAASGAYVTHGTLSATLVPNPANGSAGTVTLDITF